MSSTAGKIQWLQKNINNMAEALDVLSHGIQTIMSNQNNLNNRLVTLDNEMRTAHESQGAMAESIKALQAQVDTHEEDLYRRVRVLELLEKTANPYTMNQLKAITARLDDLEKLTAGQVTLKSVRDCGHLGERKCDFDPPESDFDFTTEEETHS